MASLSFKGNFDDAGTRSWTPSKSGYYHVLIGPDAASEFGTGGALAVSQRGIVFEDLDAVDAATRKIVHFLGGDPVTFTLTLDSGTPDLDIVVLPAE